MESRDLRPLSIGERLEWARQYPYSNVECDDRATHPNGTWSCTLARGHAGIHVAHYGPSEHWPHGEPLGYWVRTPTM